MVNNMDIAARFGADPRPEPCECLKRHDHQPPLALVRVDGGIAEEWYLSAGCGTPEVHILDFDREGETAEETVEFVKVATEVLAWFKARGIDTSDLDADVVELALASEND